VADPDDGLAADDAWSVLCDSIARKSGGRIELSSILGRRSVIREGRYRTPNREREVLMRDALKEMLGDCPVQVPRSEVEALGAEIGVEAIEAARIFDRLKGVSWRGDYVRSEGGWTAAWVREVS
jgi:hypothetical protein